MMLYEENNNCFRNWVPLCRVFKVIILIGISTSNSIRIYPREPPFYGNIELTNLNILCTLLSTNKGLLSMFNSESFDLQQNA
jgi:hypothetical protein